MSITTTISTTIASTKRRTWRVQIETPNGGTPVITGHRETISLDASGNQVGLPDRSSTPLVMGMDAAAVAALPTKYQGLPALIAAFFDDLEAGNLSAAAGK